MRYIDEFRNVGLVKKVSEKIRRIAPAGRINIMEVCGTHTQAVYRFGLDKLLPSGLRLISGPGCPVCVSGQEYIDKAIWLTQDKNNVILTFADMLRVPGTDSTLERARARYGNVRMVYSPSDAVLFASQNPSKKIIFLGVGFETTAPAIALSIMRAKEEELKNLFFYSSLKLIPPAMAHLVRDKRLNLSGFLCPGHVSCIIGTNSYEFMPKRYKIGCCVAGFEPLDILEGVYLLVRQIISNKPRVQNQYMRAVTRKGNLRAQKAIAGVFRVDDAAWRGLGIIPCSGLKIRKGFSRFDAEKYLFFDYKPAIRVRETGRCRCGDILKGLISPEECPLFSRACNPGHPIGPCMVSSEGACNAHYRYR